MRTILVVDDDKYMRKLLATILNTEGYEVHIADNGSEALKKMSDVRPQLLLLDYMMPGTTGIDVLK